MLSPATLVRVGAAVVALVVLVVVYRRTHSPSLSVAALRRRGVLILLVVVAMWCFTQLWYYMTIAYEYVFGLDAFWAAMAMVPAQVCSVLGALLAGRLVVRIGITLSGCLLLVGVGVSMLLCLVVAADSPLWLPILVTGAYSLTSVGAGVPITNAIMDSAPRGRTAAHRRSVRPRSTWEPPWASC